MTQRLLPRRWLATGAVVVIAMVLLLGELGGDEDNDGPRSRFRRTADDDDDDDDVASYNSTSTGSRQCPSPAMMTAMAMRPQATAQPMWMQISMMKALTRRPKAAKAQPMWLRISVRHHLDPHLGNETGTHAATSDDVWNLTDDDAANRESPRRGNTSSFIAPKRSHVAACMRHGASHCRSNNGNNNATFFWGDFTRRGTVNSTHYTPHKLGANYFLYRPTFEHPVSDYYTLLWCLGAYRQPTIEYSDVKVWESRSSMRTHPLMNPLHGGVSPQRLYRLAVFMQTVLGRLRNITSANDTLLLDESAPRVIVEFGGGHGALIAPMCPMHPDVFCVCADYAPSLVATGAHYFPHIHFEQTTDLVAVPDGLADLAISSCLVTLLTPSQVCAHVEEGLRVLRPGGRMVLWMMWASPANGMTHPRFFADLDWSTLPAENAKLTLNSTDILSMCTNDLGLQVEEVELLLQLNRTFATLYNPDFRRGGPWGAVLRKRLAPTHNTAGSNTRRQVPQHLIPARHPSRETNATELKRRYAAYQALLNQAASRSEKLRSSGGKWRAWVSPEELRARRFSQISPADYG